MLGIYNNKTIAHLHIPKTGGGSFRRDLQSRYSDYQHCLPEKYKLGRHCPLSEIVEIYDITKFDVIYCLVRNPYAVAVSLYHWVRRAIDNGGVYKQYVDIQPEILILLKMEFDEYIDWYIKNWNSFEDWIFVNGEIPPNVKILKMEDVKYKNYINKSKHRPFMEYYNEDTKRKIYEFDRWCFEDYYP